MKMDWLSVILLACIVCGRATSEDNEFTSTMMTTITDGTTKDSTLTEGEPRDTTTTEVTTKEATTTEGITKETTEETTTTEGTTKETTTTEGKTKETTTTEGTTTETTTTEGTTKETTTETTTTEGITEETQGTTKKATKEITTVEGATKTTTTEGTTKETTTTEGYASDTTTIVTITEMETIATTGEITTGDITKEILTGVPMTTESNPVEVSNADTLTEGTTIKLSIPVTPTSSGLGFSTDSPSQTASDLVIPLAFSVDNITFHKENDEWNNPTDTVEQNASQSTTIVASDLLSVTIPSTESFEATTLADLVAPISLSSNDIRETQSGTSISGNANLENIEISISYSQEHGNSLPDTLLYSTKDLDSLSVDPAVANEIFSASTPNVPLQSETTVAIPEDLTMESMSNLMAHSKQVQSDSTKIVTKNLTLDELDSVAISTSIPSNAGVDGITIPSIVSSDESTSTMFSNSLDNVDSPMLEAMKPSTEIPLVSMQQDISMLDTSVPSVPSVPTIPVASTVIPVASTAIPVASTAIPVASTAIPVASTAIPVASTAIPVASKDIPVDLTSYSNSPTDSVQSTSFSSSMVGSTETTSLKSSTSFPMEDNLNTVHPVDSIVGNNESLIDQSLDTISTTEDTFETAFISTTESLKDSSNVAIMNLETELAESSSQFNSKLSESTPTADPTESPILKIKSHLAPLEVAHENIAKFLHSHTSPLLNKLEESQNFDIRRDKKSTDFTNNQQSNYQEHFDFYRSVSDSLTSLEKRLG